MKNCKVVFFLFFIFFGFHLWGQNTKISGTVSAEKSVEGIHVFNKTSFKFGTTNMHGEFVIEAKLSDTLIFSSIQYQKKEVIVSNLILQAKQMKVNLEILVNQLDEILIGKILTGDLGSDIVNSDAERDLNFYDLGIPGYTGPKMTLAQRRLFEADGGPLFPYAGLGFVLNFNKFLNMVTGRTKELKYNLKLEENTDIIRHIKDAILADFFEANVLDEKLHMEFLYYCLDDLNFNSRCKGKSDFELINFLKEKLVGFNQRMAVRK